MTIESVKSKIKKKFRTFSRFARIAGNHLYRDVQDDERAIRYAFQLRFTTAPYQADQEISRISKLCDSLNPKSDATLITPGKLAALKRAIAKQGGVLAFCRKSGLNKANVYRLVYGHVKTKSGAAREIFRLAKVKI